MSSSLSLERLTVSNKFHHLRFQPIGSLYLTIHIYSCIADEEFEDLCFEYGLEVEFGNGADMNMARLDGDGNAIDMSKHFIYKVEVPANRYDLLCLEGLATALKAYISEPGAYQYPQYKVSKPKKLERVTVKKETKGVRQYVVSAILRNIKFTE